MTCRPSRTGFWSSIGCCVAGFGLGCAGARGPAPPPAPATVGSSLVAGARAPGASGPGSGSAPAAIACPAGMHAIPGGTFEMGTDRGPEKSRPRHRVTISSFCMAAAETTVAEYRQCVDAGVCREPAFEGGVCDRARARPPHHARDCVDFTDAAAYCAWRGARLPTEAEWEYVAGGGTARRPYATGDAAPDERTACVGRRSEPCLPRSFPPEAFGLYDLAGNLTEWVADASAPYPSEPQVDPFVPGDLGNRWRIARGGSFRDPEDSYHVYWIPARYVFPASVRDATTGFRCATSPPDA